MVVLCVATLWVTTQNAPFSDRNKSFQTFLKTFEIASSEKLKTDFAVYTKKTQQSEIEFRLLRLKRKKQDQLRKLCNGAGIRPPRRIIVAGEYLETGITGASPSRPPKVIISPALP